MCVLLQAWGSAKAVLSWLLTLTTAPVPVQVQVLVLGPWCLNWDNRLEPNATPASRAACHAANPPRYSWV